MKNTNKMINTAGSNSWKCFWRDGADSGVMDIQAEVAFALIQKNVHTKEVNSNGETIYSFDPVAIFY